MSEDEPTDPTIPGMDAGGVEGMFSGPERREAGENGEGGSDGPAEAGTASQATQGRENRLGDGKGLKIATEEDFGIHRTEDGDFEPIPQRIPGTDFAVKVRPLTPGKRTEFRDVLLGADAPAHRVAQLFADHIVEGIGSDVDPNRIPTPEELPPGDEADLPIPYGIVPGLIQAIKNSSGEQVFRATTRQREAEAKRGIEMAREAGVDVEKAMAELANSGEIDDGPT